MKRIAFSALFILLALLPIGATEDTTLRFQSCSLRDGQIYAAPLSYVNLYLDDVYEQVTIPRDSIATVYCNGEEVATGKVSVEHPTMSGKVYPFVQIDFDSIMLPKGNRYQLLLPANTVTLERDKTIGNEVINISFEVPEYLPAWEDNAIVLYQYPIKSAKHLFFYFFVETKEKKDIKTILYRENKPVRELIAYSGWDWDLGQVHATWEKEMYFEKDVNYSFVLPEGSVCALYRDDLVNKEERMNFVGGSDKSFPELKHSWCNLDGVKTIGALNEVKWIYNSKVALSLAPSIELHNEAGELLKSVVPTLTENGGKWILSADFEGYTINPAETYHLILPESTVVTPSGDVVVNKRSTIRIVKGETGIDDVTDNNISITCVHNQVRIEGTPPGDHIALYTVAGSAIATLQADGSTVTLDLPQPGIYVVVVNGKAHKVVNR